MAQLQKEKKILFPYHNSSVCKHQARIFFLDTCSYLYVCTCLWKPEVNLRYHFSCIIHPFFWGGDVFPLAWASLIRQGWLTSKLQGFSCLYLLSNETTSVHHPIWLFMWALRPELRSSCCRLSASPTELHPVLLLDCIASECFTFKICCMGCWSEFYFKNKMSLLDLAYN